MAAAMPFMLVFRFLHIVAGVLWVGSAFLFVGSIGPSAGEVAPSAGPLMHAVVKKRKVAKVITELAAITVVAGWVMWLKDMSDWGGLGDWLGSSLGVVLTIGAVLATIAFFLGYHAWVATWSGWWIWATRSARRGVRPRRNSRRRWGDRCPRSRSTGSSTCSCSCSRWRRCRSLATGSRPSVVGRI